jgi:hypothetical protein
MPELNTPNRCAAQHIGNRGSIDFGDERGLAFREEVFNPWKSRHERGARSENGAFPTTTSNATRCRMTASRSFGLYRMR